MVRLVVISDTHNNNIPLPEGDILVHCGDMTSLGTPKQVADFNHWVRSIKIEHKIIIAGNHDFLFEENNRKARILLPDCVYLQDSGCEVLGLSFWGSPWQPAFCDWAFNLKTEIELQSKWELIPKNTDVLITHGPPKDTLDRTMDGRLVGSSSLRDAVESLKPKAHLFGHIHESYGTTNKHGTKFVNASTCTLSYRPSNAPVVLDL